jgi:hypothetical protein
MDRNRDSKELQGVARSCKELQGVIIISLGETFYYLLEWFGKPQRAQRKIRTLRDLSVLCGEFFVPRSIYPEYIKKSRLGGGESPFHGRCDV